MDSSSMVIGLHISQGEKQEEIIWMPLLFMKPTPQALSCHRPLDLLLQPLEKNWQISRVNQIRMNVKGEYQYN
jgi:hypothetical protein